MFQYETDRLESANREDKEKTIFLYESLSGKHRKLFRQHGALPRIISFLLGQILTRQRGKNRTRAVNGAPRQTERATLESTDNLTLSRLYIENGPIKAGTQGSRLGINPESLLRSSWAQKSIPANLTFGAADALRGVIRFLITRTTDRRTMNSTVLVRADTLVFCWPFCVVRMRFIAVNRLPVQPFVPEGPVKTRKWRSGRGGKDTRNVTVNA